MISYLRGIYGAGLVEFSYFEVSAEIAIYWLAYDWHRGQASELYSILSTSPYHPSCLCGGIGDEDDDLVHCLAHWMYNDLVKFIGE